MNPSMFEIRGETIAFSRFMHNYSQASSYLNLTQYFDFDKLLSSSLAEKQAQPLSDSEKTRRNPLIITARLGKFVAAKLAVVYIVTIMETYIKDALLELVRREQRTLVLKLMEGPGPMSEDEAIMFDIRMDNAMDDETHPAYRLGRLSAEYIASRMSRDSLAEGIRLLKTYYGVHILDELKHLRRWNELKKLRNLIVHYADSEEVSAAYQNVAPKVQEIAIDFDFLAASIDQTFEFAKAIEEGIFDSMHGAKENAE